MRSIGMAAVVGLTAFASVGIVALSWHPNARADTRRRAAPGLVKARGTVAQVDATAGWVRLDLPDRVLELRVGPETTVFIDGRIGDAVELRPGTRVCAAYAETGEARPLAEWLEPCAR